jgi:hypothetical protein
MGWGPCWCRRGSCRRMLHHGPLLAGLRMAWARDRNLGLLLEQILCLLLGGYVEDVLQLTTLLVDLVDLGHG